VADVSVFGPFKTRLKTAGAKHEHNGHSVIQPKEVASFTRKAWEESATPENIVSGFEKTGIFPFNRDRLDKRIFIQGVRHRGTPENPRIFCPPPLPTMLPSLLDPDPISSPSSSLPPTVLESVDSILHLPDPIPLPSKSTRKPSTIDTSYAVMLTAQEIRHQLKRKRDEKEKEEKERAEKRRKKEEKKQHASSKPTPKPKITKPKSIRLKSKISNKENIDPNTSHDDYDPYSHHTK
jgi:hypothetical protein